MAKVVELVNGQQHNRDKRICAVGHSLTISHQTQKPQKLYVG